MQLRRQKATESDLGRRLRYAVDSLPQTRANYQFCNYVPMLEEHTSLLKECEAMKPNVEQMQYEACHKLLMYDACIYAVWIENGSDNSQATLKHFCRTISGIAKKLKKLAAQPEYSVILPTFHKLVLLARDLFHDDNRANSNKDLEVLSQIVAGFNDKADQSTADLNSQDASPNVPSQHVKMDIVTPKDAANIQPKRMPKLDSENAPPNFADQVATMPSDSPQEDFGGVSNDMIVTGSTSSNSNRDDVCWTHLSRSNDGDPVCFICKSDDKSDALEFCGAKSPEKCSTRFHIRCLQKFNGGGFFADYVKSLVDHYQCPLHHCDICWQDRHKSSAVYTKSFMVECRNCFRGYHEECLPAGLPIFEEGKLKTTICHSHSTFVETGRRLLFCCECEKRDVDLVKCSQCIRSFHMQCRSFHNAKGDKFKNFDNVCGSCFYGESLKAGQAVIARSSNGLFSGIAVELSKYPAHSASVDPYGKYLGKPGFIPVEWSGCQNLFNLIPATRTMAMFANSHAVCKVSHKDKDYDEVWKQLEANLEAVRPSFNLLVDRHKDISHSVYHHSTPQPRLPTLDLEDVLCRCPDDDVDRCGPNSSCTARLFLHECPQACESKGRLCNNRLLSKKMTHPLIQRRVAEGKGQGVFATGIIKKGDTIGEYAGEILSNAEQERRNTLSSQAQDQEEMHYSMSLDKTRSIDCKYKGNIARFINHSCAPNCKVETVDIEISNSGASVKYDKRVRVVALTEITEDEELSFSYNMVKFSSESALPECRCNAPNCTGTLGRAIAKSNTVQSSAVRATNTKLVPSRPRKRGVPVKTEINTKDKRRKSVKKERIDLMDDLPLSVLRDVLKQEVSEGDSISRTANVLTVKDENCSLEESAGQDISDIQSTYIAPKLELDDAESGSVDLKSKVYVSLDENSHPRQESFNACIIVKQEAVENQLQSSNLDLVGDHIDQGLVANTDGTLIVLNSASVITRPRTKSRAAEISAIAENTDDNNSSVKYNRKRKLNKAELTETDDVKEHIQLSCTNELARSEVSGNETVVRRSSPVSQHPNGQ